jgi:hypothetical protein
MFHGWYEGTSMWKRLVGWLVPILSTDTVVQRIMQAIRCREDMVVSCAPGWRGVLFCPLPALLHLLPVAAMDFITGHMGLKDGMDTFVGRKRHCVYK